MRKMGSSSSRGLDLKGIPSADIMTELLHRMKCASKSDKRLILIGPSGSGRGTQSPINDEYFLCHLASGDDMLRAAFEANNLVAKKDVEAIVKRIGLIDEDLKKPSCQKGFFLDGFPKTVIQAKELDEMLQSQGTEIDNVISFATDDATSEKMITGVDYGGPTPSLFKEEVLRSAWRETLSEEERILRTVKRILNKRTPEKFDLLKSQLIESGIATAGILKGVVSLIFEKAVLEPTFSPLYAQLCSILHKKLPPVPSDEPGRKEITFRRVLLNNCQEAFEGANKLRAELRNMTAPEQELERRDIERLVKLGTICLIGELFKQKMITENIVHHVVQELIGPDTKSCPAEENVEAICQFFITVGEQLDEYQQSRCINDIHFGWLEEASTNPQLAPRLRFMLRDVLDLRSNNWVPRLKEVKAKTITEILAEAENYIGSQPGATANFRNNGGIGSGSQGNTGPGGLPINPPTTVGMIPGIPKIDNDYCEVPRSLLMPRADGSTVQPTGHFQPPLIQSLSPNLRLLPQVSGSFIRNSGALPANGIASYGEYAVGPGSQVPAPSRTASTVPVAPLIIKNPDGLRRKTVSLLEEYFSVGLLDEVLQCIEELESPAYHPAIVMASISLGLEKRPPCVEPVVKLLEYLFAKKVFTVNDLSTGCLLYASFLDDLAIDIPKAQANFGEIVRKLVLAGGLDFKLVRKIMKKVGDNFSRKAIFTGTTRIV